METMEPIRIIIYEDFHAETESVIREFEDSELRILPKVVTSTDGFKSALRTFKPDVILSPYSLTNTNAIKLLSMARKEGCTAPFILLAFDLSEDIAIDLLGAGIEDYVMRSTLKRLPVAVKKALQRHKIQLELMLSELRLRASEASLREAQKIAKVGSWEWDIATGQVNWSDQMYDIYEVERQEVNLDLVRSFIHPEDRDRVAQLTEGDLGAPFHPIIEYRILLGDGTEKYVV